MAGAPSKTINLPTNSLDSIKSDLRTLEQLHKKVQTEMAKSYKQGKEISADLVDKNKKIKAAIDGLKKQQTDLTRGMQTDAALGRLAGANAGASLGDRYNDAVGFYSRVRHATHVAHGLNRAQQAMQEGRPLEAAGDMLESASMLAHLVPGYGHAAAITLRALAGIVQYFEAARLNHLAQERGARVDQDFFQGKRWRPELDEDLKRLKSNRLGTSLEERFNHIYEPFNSHAGEGAMGTNIKPEDFHEFIARSVRNHPSVRSWMRFINSNWRSDARGGSQLFDMFGNSIDDETKVNEKVNEIETKIRSLREKIKEAALLNNIFQADFYRRQLKDTLTGAYNDHSMDALRGPSPEAILQASRAERLWAKQHNREFMGTPAISGRDE